MNGNSKEQKLSNLLCHVIKKQVLHYQLCFFENPYFVWSKFNIDQSILK